MFQYLLFMLLTLWSSALGKTVSKDNINVCAEMEGLKNDKGLCYLLLFKGL